MRPGALTVGGVHGAALLLSLAGVGSTLWYGVDEPGNALAFGTLMVLGEFARWGAAPDEREPAPLAAAGALAYALLGASAGTATTHGVLQIVAVVVAAGLAGIVPHLARGRGPASIISPAASSPSDSPRSASSPSTTRGPSSSTSARARRTPSSSSCCSS